jgi:hypothetical protein
VSRLGLDPVENKFNLKQMTYWRNNLAGGTTTTAILSQDDANGNCQAWSMLFRDCLRLQTISASRILLTAEPNDPGLLVKEWSFHDPPSGSGRYPYLHPQDLVDTWGVAGQGNPNPGGGFTVHYVTLSNFAYYDPSYGSEVVAGSDLDKSYEDKYLAGYSWNPLTAGRKNDLSANSPAEVTHQIAD